MQSKSGRGEDQESNKQMTNLRKKRTWKPEFIAWLDKVNMTQLKMA